MLEVPLFFLMRPASTGSAPFLLGHAFAAGESLFYCEWGGPFLFGDPKFCWGRPISAQLLLGCPLLQGHLSFARDASSGVALPLRGTSLSCQGHPFSSYGAPLFAWAPLFCSERGTTLLLLGHSPSAGVALPLPQGRPSCAEYTPFLLVMRRPSSTGGAQQLLSAGAPICCWGVSRLPDIVNGAPLSCLASPTSAEGSPSLINFCCGASLLLGRPSSAEGAPLLQGAPLFCWGAPLRWGARLLLEAPFSCWAPSAAGGAPFLPVAPIFYYGAPLFLCWGAHLRLGRPSSSWNGGASLLLLGRRSSSGGHLSCQECPS